MRFVALVGVALALSVGPARAEWVEASSDHFVIYGDQSAEKVRQFAERLELYQAVMSYAHGAPRTKPSPSNRVRIYSVANASTVRKVLGTKDEDLVGIYIARAGGSVALIPKLTKEAHQEMSGESILYHEYAHHFMRTVLTPRVLPRWLSEGFAEFYANPQFRDGTIAIGAPPYYRAYELRNGREVPIRTMLSSDGGDDGSEADGFYGQSWLLFHYLQMEPERSGQLFKYMELLSSGKPALAAAEGAFGDLDKLNKDMDSYMRRRKLTVRVIDRSVLNTGSITVRTLRAGEAAMMPVIIESNVGVDKQEATALVPVARRIAAEFSDDATVLAALAEAEYDAGNDDAAIAAADRALAIDSNQIDAHLQKGFALARKALSNTPTAPSWKDVRAQFIKANAVENDHPVPLLYFYLTYKMSGLPPTQNAINGIEWALKLAPYDHALRWLVARQMVTDERLSDAIVTLGPLAFSPHPSKETQEALTLLKQLEGRRQASSNSKELPAAQLKSGE